MDSNHCRICLESSRRLKSIFFSQTKFDVPTFVKEFCNISILENDGFTNKICRMCLDKTQMAFDFRAKCVESDQILRIKNDSVVFKLPEHDIPTELPPFLDIKLESLESVSSTPQDIYGDDKEALNLSISQLGFESFSTHDESNQIQSNTETDIKQEIQLNSEEDCDEDDVSKKEEKKKRGRNLEKSHMCSVCGKTFFTSGHLRSHELTHNNSKEFTCHSCEKKFLTKSYLNRHMKSHLNERNYKCKVCQKGFNTSTSLGYHFRLVHSGEMNFHCTFCNKGFPLKIQLISHTRSHSGEKPHKCDQCDKKYSHKIDLKRHMMLHTGNKPYKCPYCERTFTKKSNMECHIPTHTGEKPYKCSICYKEFRQPCPYRKHMQTHVAEKSMNVESVPAGMPSSFLNDNTSTSIS